jgi:hypothetical protein
MNRKNIHYLRLPTNVSLDLNYCVKISIYLMSFLYNMSLISTSFFYVIQHNSK